MTDLAQTSDADLLASLPRGVRSNNPLNLKGGDGQFRSFNSQDEGVAAADANLAAYGSKHGINTLAGAISRWAPPSENDTASYIANVSKATGIDPNARIDLADAGTRKTLLTAMATHENGTQVIPHDLSSVSNEELLASLKGGSAPTVAPAMPKAAPARPVAPRAPVKGPSALADTATALLAGVSKGAANVADMVTQAGPMGTVLSALKTGLNVNDVLHGKAPPSMTGPVSALSGALNGIGYKPKTTAGEVAQTVGTMLPNALIPASRAGRVANVILPALGQEGGTRAAKALGAGETGQRVAGAVGATLGGAGASLRLAPKVATDKAMTLEQLSAANTAKWNAVDASGYRFPKNDVTAAARDIRGIVKDAGPDLYPEASKIANRVASLAAKGNLTPAQANRLRSQVGEKLLQPGSTEASIGGDIKARIDALIDGANDPNLAEARDLHTRFKKMEEVTKRMDSADLAQETAGVGGNQNAIRTKLKPLIDPKSPQRMRNLSPDEKAAVRQVTKGTATQNALRLLTAFDPTAGKLQAMLSTGMAGATLGKSAMLMPVGMAAKAGERAIGEASIQKLLDLIARGGKPIAQSGGPLRLSSDYYAGLAAPTSLMLSGAIPTTALAKPKRSDRRP